MNDISNNPSATQLDVRVIPGRQKHATIFQRWTELPVGAHFVLINDHDPVPLYYQFAAQFPGAFTWEYLKTGPDEYQVKITRVAASAAPAPIPALLKPVPAAAAPAGELDARGLEPPTPLMRILSAVETLAAGATLRARTDRRPLHLYPELDTRGVRYTSAEQPDGSWITTLHRA